MKRWEERGKQVRAKIPKSFYNHLDNNNFLLTHFHTALLYLREPQVHLEPRSS